MNLKEDIQTYIEANGKHLQNVKTAFENFDLKETIEKAAKAIDPTNDNKMFSHQRRVGYKVAYSGYESLKERENDLRNCRSFEEILEITNEVSKQIFRLGQLWSYDTALRIGFQKKVYPKNVYLQAGVLKGYKKIFNRNPKDRFEEKNKFPKELQILEPYEIENFLCIWGNNKKTNPVRCN
ncbi:hypothetical protein [Flavobacterium cyclinae]|uniref:hypothetical protein n=1 Tax=Flavobacterium cyclinae TaxID=2895947 RepID=UPI001E2EE61A|nr:hypothetical protein [Flavobacterium cyclinae]UGS21837.1 hypothetical protein LOS86_04210 [Flavobacterium cyclinae]